MLSNVDISDYFSSDLQRGEGRLETPIFPIPLRNPVDYLEKKVEFHKGFNL